MKNIVLSLFLGCSLASVQQSPANGFFDVQLDEQERMKATSGTMEYLHNMSEAELENMQKWGFLKNIINIDTFFDNPKHGKDGQENICKSTSCECSEPKLSMCPQPSPLCCPGGLQPPKPPASTRPPEQTMCSQDACQGPYPNPICGCPPPIFNPGKPSPPPPTLAPVPEPVIADDCSQPQPCSQPRPNPACGCQGPAAAQTPFQQPVYSPPQQSYSPPQQSYAPPPLASVAPPAQPFGCQPNSCSMPQPDPACGCPAHRFGEHVIINKSDEMIRMEAELLKAKEAVRNQQLREQMLKAQEARAKQIDTYVKGQ